VREPHPCVDHLGIGRKWRGRRDELEEVGMRGRNAVAVCFRGFQTDHRNPADLLLGLQVKAINRLQV